MGLLVYLEAPLFVTIKLKTTNKIICIKSKNHKKMNYIVTNIKSSTIKIAEMYT